MNACPMSSSVIALERWAESAVESLLLVVVGVRGRTKTAQGHVEGREEWVEESEVVATGLVPGFAYQPSSTIVGSERVVLMVGWGMGPDLSDDEVAVEGVGSEHKSSKRWCRRCFVPDDGNVDGDGGVVGQVMAVVGVVVVDGGVWNEERRWTRVGDVEGGCKRVVVIEVDVVNVVAGDGDREVVVMVMGRTGVRPSK